MSLKPAQNTYAGCPSGDKPALLYDVEDVTEIGLGPAEEREMVSGETHLLLVVLSGSGTIDAEGESRKLASPVWLLLSPDRSARIWSGPDAALRTLRIAFTAVVMSKGSPEIWKKEIIPLGESPKPASARALRLCHNLTEMDNPEDELEREGLHLAFQQLLLQLRRDDLALGAEQLRSRALAFVHNRFADTLTVAELAAESGLPQQQFTAMFRQWTGLRPLEYVNQLRVEDAKRRLLDSKAPLREIARLSGFRDEYYFSRRFRDATGESPRQYALSRQRKSRSLVKDWLGRKVEVPLSPERIIYHGEMVGDLSALGVPIVGGSAFWEQRHMLREYTSHVEDVGFSLQPEKLQPLHPDLIIVGSSSRSKVERAQSVAPALSFDTFARLEDRLLRLGDLLGKRGQAESWLKEHDFRTKEMWKKIAPQLDGWNEAAVFSIDRGGRLFVMASIGLPCALYHPDGFRPPVALQPLLQEEVPYVEIKPGDIRRYTGDWTFFVVADDPRCRRAADRLFQSEEWQSRQASGRFFRLASDRWNFGDALTRQRLLDWLPELLAGSGQNEWDGAAAN